MLTVVRIFLRLSKKAFHLLCERLADFGRLNLGREVHDALDKLGLDFVLFILVVEDQFHPIGPNYLGCFKGKAEDLQVVLHFIGHGALQITDDFKGHRNRRSVPDLARSFFCISQSSVVDEAELFVFEHYAGEGVFRTDDAHLLPIGQERARPVCQLVDEDVEKRSKYEQALYTSVMRQVARSKK